MSRDGQPPAALSTDELRALLAERLRTADGPARSIPLSSAQQRLWFLDQVEPDSPLYNLPSVARLTGTLDAGALERSLNTILRRHESWRTRFLSREGEPEQVIDEDASLELRKQDLTHIGEAAREDEMRRRVREEITRPFNLSTDRLVRATLLRLKPDEHVLVLSQHHIITDEWSVGVLFRELSALYRGFVEGKPVTLPELPIQYSDYAMWQRDWMQSEGFRRQLSFWKEQLSGNPGAVELPTDHPRRAKALSRGAGRWRQMRRELTKELKKLAGRERATLFMVLLAALDVLLWRYTQQEDIIVGSPMAGRTRMETEGLIGFFVNAMPLRARIAGNPTFRELLAQVREVALGAYSNQDLPFERLVAELHPDRELEHMPYIRVMFLFQNLQPSGVQLPGLEVQFLGMGTDTAKFDLTLGAHETHEGLVVGTEYDAELFEDSTIARLLEHYEMLLEGVVAQPGCRLSELPLLGEAERNQVLVEWNNTRTEYPRNRCVHELFEEQAAKTPDNIAVISGERRSTYWELNARASQLAHYLRRAGVQPRMRVGLCAERSLDMLIGMLGILKAGAAYAPLDPGLPKERLALMLEDLQVPVLLTQHGLLGALPEMSGEGTPAPQSVCLDADWPIIGREDNSNLYCEVEAEDVAYISFTSGSTGRPKGVCVPHRGIVRLVMGANWASFSAAEVFLQTAPVSFDASLFEVWGCLLHGGRLVVVPPRIPSLSELAELIDQQRVTTAWFTTGLFNQMVEEAPQALKALGQVVTGGDVASPRHFKRALELLGNHGRLLNGYGPTECTTFTTIHPVPADYDGERAVPIGRAIANTECYILDKHLQPVPIGVPGELYAGGDGLATGYLNRPDLTAERFVSNPFQPGTRLYKTGDLVRYLPDGNIEFLARIDLQVKIRGFRVELGEIETRLLQHPAVRECVVTARPDASGTKQLVAYVVPWQGQTNPSQPAATPPSRAGQSPGLEASNIPQPTRWQAGANQSGRSLASDLQEYLRRHLPDYMIPASFVTLAELPLAATGKVDRRALPAPELKAETGAEAQLQPRDDIERQLQQLWETVLNVRPIGIRDKFFALGGHSLLAVRLVSQVERIFGKKLRVTAVFQNPTIEQLAGLLRDGQSTRPATSIVEIQPHGSKPAVFFVHGAGGGMFWGYSNLARHLGPDQPVFAFKSRGLDGLEEYGTIETMAKAYLGDLRRFQPHGPYYLGGYCFGGVVAYEMACRLRAEGETVALLALINANTPNSSYTQFRWTPASAFRFAVNVCRRGVHFLQVPRERLFDFVRWKAQVLAKRACCRFGVASAELSTGSADEVIDLSQYSADQRRVWHTHLRAQNLYHAGAYPGRVTLFRSPLHILYCSYDRAYGWNDVARGGVDVKIIPGAHETIMEEPGVQALAMEFRGALAEAQAAAVDRLQTTLES